MIIPILISAFCVICGVRRGNPVLKNIGGLWSHHWINPCGHTDTPASLKREVEAQCARDNCVVMHSESFHPYCSIECVGDTAKDVFNTLKWVLQSSEDLAEIIERNNFPVGDKPQSTVELLRLALQSMRYTRVHN